MSLVLNGSSQYATGPGAVFPQSRGSALLWAYHGLEETDDTPWKYWDVDTVRNTVAHRDGDQGFQYYIDGRTHNFTFTGGWTVNTWVPIIGRWNKATSYIDLNISGVTLTPAAQSGTWGSNSPGTNFFLGARFAAAFEYFTGKIAWFSLWDGLLDDTAVTALQAGSHPAGFSPWIDTWPMSASGVSLNGSDSLSVVGSPSYDANTDPTIGPSPVGARNYLAAADSVPGV
jgi:hypothetical protein